VRLNHHRAGHLLSAYLDGELSPQDAAGVQEHLLDCAACREAYERLRTTKALLGELPPAEPPAEFWAALRAPQAPPRRRTAGRAPAAPDVSIWRGLTIVRRPAWALAAILLVVALAATPLIKGTVDRLHATEIGVDLYVREHAIQMGTGPLADRAYLGLVATDADLVLVGETPRAGAAGP